MIETAKFAQRTDYFILNTGKQITRPPDSSTPLINNPKGNKLKPKHHYVFVMYSYKTVGPIDLFLDERHLGPIDGILENMPDYMHYKIFQFPSIVLEEQVPNTHTYLDNT